MPSKDVSHSHVQFDWPQLQKCPTAEIEHLLLLFPSFLTVFHLIKKGFAIEGYLLLLVSVCSLVLWYIFSDERTIKSQSKSAGDFSKRWFPRNCDDSGLVFGTLLPPALCSVLLLSLDSYSSLTRLILFNTWLALSASLWIEANLILLWVFGPRFGAHSASRLCLSSLISLGLLYFGLSSLHAVGFVPTCFHFSTLLFALLVNVGVFDRCLTALPHSFTYGEAQCIAITIAAWLTDSLRLSLAHSIFPRTDVYIAISAAFFSLFSSAVCASVIFNAAAASGKTLSSHARASVQMVFLVVWAWVWGLWAALYLHMSPLRWLQGQILSCTKCQELLLLWIFLGGAAVAVGSAGARIWRRLPNIVMRKLFHAIAVFLFTPAILIQPGFLRLATGGAGALFFLAEYLRFFNCPVVGPRISNFLHSFTDARDAGAVIVTHLYLLLGCALPLWFVSVDDRFAQTLIRLAGILVLGIADAVASVVGTYFGRTRLFGSKKTAEGLVGGWLSLLLSAWAVTWYSGVSGSTEQWLAVVFFSFLSCLLETVTLQIDNLVLPVYFALLLHFL